MSDSKLSAERQSGGTAPLENLSVETEKLMGGCPPTSCSDLEFLEKAVPMLDAVFHWKGLGRVHLKGRVLEFQFGHCTVGLGGIGDDKYFGSFSTDRGLLSREMPVVRLSNPAEIRKLDLVPSSQPDVVLVKPMKTPETSTPDELGAAPCSGFLPAEQIRIGSWWAAADGGKYGCVVLSVNLKTKDATVLGTDGKQREIDTFKLQYRYGHCIPNKLLGEP